MNIDCDGWLSEGMQVTSPNQDARPENTKISLVVIHAISLPPEKFGGPGITSLFTNAIDPGIDNSYAGIGALKVSAHLVIRRDGALVQYVSFLRRAWHAGVSSWNGRDGCNDFSIGIELEGSDHQAFSDSQYRSLNEVLHALMVTYPVEGVCGHCHIAPNRKTDPGSLFEWTRISYPRLN